MNTYLTNNAPTVALVCCTPCMEETVAVAAEMCYSSKDSSELIANSNTRKSKYLIDKLASMGHESPFEHACFTFAISGISRACSHQLVRHRIASYSQRSQRYVDEEGFDYILPPAIEDNKFARSQYVSHMARVDNEYNSLKLTLLGSKICEYNNDIESTLWGMTNAEIGRLCEQFKKEHVVKAVNELKQEMSSMKEAMSKYKIYLDKKTLVGEMVDDMDTALGRKAEIARRAGR